MAPVPLVVRRILPGAARDVFLRSLTTAAGGEAATEVALADGDVFALVDLAAGPQGAPLAAVVVVNLGDGGAAVERPVVSPDRGDGCHGLTPADLMARLIAGLVDAARGDGVRRLGATAED